MGRVVEFLREDGLQLAEVISAEKKRLNVCDSRGRSYRLTADKVLFEHPARHSDQTAGRADALDSLDGQISRLMGEIDVELLWETVQDGVDAAIGASELAALYFDCADSLHASATYRALSRERVFFRRKGSEFEARTRDEIAQIQKMHAAEAEAEREHEQLKGALSRKQLGDDIANRLERLARGQTDKALEKALSEVRSVNTDLWRHAHWLLVDAGHLPPTSDPEVFSANLSQEFDEELQQAASSLVAPSDDPGRAAFSIDDPETREVDDALSARRDGELTRVDIDIADVGRLVEIDSPLDQEARKRASSVYLPTRTITMFPDALGCGTASLQHGQTRAALRTSVWCNDEGEVVRFELSRELIRVERRLDYRQVDALLANGTPGDPLVKELSLLATLARARRERRKSAGALFIRRDEWKLKVDQEQRIEVSPIVGFSQSRSLVAEMMILANELAAKKAQQGGIPLLYRVQDAPAATLPKIDENDPNALSKLRGMIKPAHQSLHLGAHWGLGVSGYAQVTSPLRRYGDLVLQRQLAASIDGQTPPYDNDELLAVMATIEATELAGKRLESAVQQRWALEYVAQHRDERHPALVMSDTRSGFKVQLQSCGAEGLLPTRASLELGSMIEVAIEQVRPRQGSLRVAL